MHKVLCIFAFAVQLLASVSEAELLVVDDVDCPPQLPNVACFHASGGTPMSAEAGAHLPLDVTLEYTRKLLQKALQIEHSTIPLYLTSLYSIRNQSSFEATVLRSVVMEEMLHMVQAANALNAIGL